MKTNAFFRQLDHDRKQQLLRRGTAARHVVKRLFKEHPDMTIEAEAPAPTPLTAAD